MWLGRSLLLPQSSKRNGRMRVCHDKVPSCSQSAADENGQWKVGFDGPGVLSKTALLAIGSATLALIALAER